MATIAGKRVAASARAPLAQAGPSPSGIEFVTTGVPTRSTGSPGGSEVTDRSKPRELHAAYCATREILMLLNAGKQIVVSVVSALVAIAILLGARSWIEADVQKTARQHAAVLLGSGVFDVGKLNAYIAGRGGHELVPADYSSVLPPKGDEIVSEHVVLGFASVSPVLCITALCVALAVGRCLVDLLVIAVRSR